MLMTRLTPFVVVAALLVAGCGSQEPALPPVSDVGKIHELLIGPRGQDFLIKLSTYGWRDKGGRAAELFNWISRDAASVDTAAAARAGETAHALAVFVGDRDSELLNINTGWFGLRHQTVGALNPKLVQGYAAALIPFQGALACDPVDGKGFKSLGYDCAAILARSRPMFTVLNTDLQAADIFSDAAYKRMDAYIARFAAGVVDRSKGFDQGPTLAGTLLGLVTVGAARSGIRVPTVQDGENRANYVTAKTVLANRANPGLPPEYFANGALLSPDEIEQKLGRDVLAAYYASLAIYLNGVDDAESHISKDFRQAYWTATGKP
jgi:hypothetical protein